MDNQPQLLQQSLALVGVIADLKTTDLIWNITNSLIKNGEFGVKEAFDLKCEMEKKYEPAPESFEPVEVPKENPDPFMEVIRDRVDESIQQTPTSHDMANQELLDSMLGVGDVVVGEHAPLLKMTVKEILGNLVICEWHDGTEFRSQTFQKSELKKLTSNES